MQIQEIPIEPTFAEAFDMVASRLVITATNASWARRAAESMTGFATSVIGCGIEAGIESEIPANQTPDGRPGVSVLTFSTSRSELQRQLVNRVGQCVLTSPGSSVFAGLTSDAAIELGSKLRYFGDGHQISKFIGGRRYWRIPVMDGEFVCEESLYRVPAIGGGNFIVLAQTIDGALRACEEAVAAIDKVQKVITPFPGGVARSGSKVGSKYPQLMASTNDAFCPTLRRVCDSQVDENCSAALEIVIDGLDTESIRDALRAGIEAVCRVGKKYGVERITGGNYGGKLGKHHFHLHDLFSN